MKQCWKWNLRNIFALVDLSFGLTAVTIPQLLVATVYIAAEEFHIVLSRSFRERWWVDSFLLFCLLSRSPFAPITRQSQSKEEEKALFEEHTGEVSTEGLISASKWTAFMWCLSSQYSPSHRHIHSHGSDYHAGCLLFIRSTNHSPTHAPMEQHREQFILRHLAQGHLWTCRLGVDSPTFQSLHHHFTAAATAALLPAVSVCLKVWKGLFSTQTMMFTWL